MGRQTYQRKMRNVTVRKEPELRYHWRKEIKYTIGNYIRILIFKIFCWILIFQYIHTNQRKFQTTSKEV